MARAKCEDSWKIAHFVSHNFTHIAIYEYHKGVYREFLRCLEREENRIERYNGVVPNAVVRRDGRGRRVQRCVQ